MSQSDKDKQEQPDDKNRPKIPQPTAEPTRNLWESELKAYKKPTPKGNKDRSNNDESDDD